MATNGVNDSTDADMSECDGEKVVTMMDVLQEEQDFEDDANAVLGASDEKNCTYAKGYIKRQAVYACLTCCSEAKTDPSKRAGVCLACSLHCHENHDLVELYTKRNFRCDCGNPKFNSHPCQFTPNKPDLNEDNSYNQNFSGLYCTCQRPYPDPGSPVEDDEMIQCIVCEDWLHASHLEAAVPAVDQYAEMVCKNCMQQNEFLHDYSYLVVNIEPQDIDVDNINGNEAKMANGDVTETVTNGTIETNVEPAGTVAKSSDNMEVDVDTQNEKMTDRNEDESQVKTTEHNMETESTIDNLEKRAGENSSLTKHDELERTSEVQNDEVPIKSTSDNNEKLQESTKNKNDSNTEDLDIKKEDAAKQSPVPTEIQESRDPDELNDNIDNVMKPEDSLENDKLVEDKNENKELEENKSEEVQVNSEDKKPAENNVLNEDSEIPENIKSIPEVDNKVSENPSQTEPENDELPQTVPKDTELDKNDSDVPQTELNKVTEAEDTDLNKIAEESAKVETTNVEESHEVLNEASTNEPTEREAAEPDNTNKLEETTETNDNKRKLDDLETHESEEILVKKPKMTEESTCIRPRAVKRVHRGATFWPTHFRQKLCTCSECLSMYRDLNVLFLTDPEDTVSAYEALGKERVQGRATQYEKGLQALSSLDRIQQINALTEYNKMKDKLLDYLKSFKDRKEVVKEEDIKAFFANMKPKRESDGVYFCR